MRIACIIAFNEEAMLPGCLESIYKQVNQIVVVDGAYAHFPHIAPYSTDKTRQIAEAYGARWIETPPGGWFRQYIKRTAYLVGNEGDWYLHIDADERLIGMLPTPEDGKTYALSIANRAGRPGWGPRLFQHRGQMRYDGAHNALWSDDTLINLRDAVRIPPKECRLLHLAHLRSAQRQLDKRDYYAWQKPAERPYRRRHGI